MHSLQLSSRPNGPERPPPTSTQVAQKPRHIAFISDVSQNPLQRPKAASTIPAHCRSSCFYSHSRQRLLSPLELSLLQGIKLSLLGNGMHLAVSALALLVKLFGYAGGSHPPTVPQTVQTPSTDSHSGMFITVPELSTQRKATSRRSSLKRVELEEGEVFTSRVSEVWSAALHLLQLWYFLPLEHFSGTRLV